MGRTQRLACLALRDDPPSLLWPLLTSATPSAHLSTCLATTAGPQISQGKARDFHSTYPPHIRHSTLDDFRASGLCAPSPSAMTPRMRFVFLGPELCLQLPSDPTSRWAPLLFG